MRTPDSTLETIDAALGAGAVTAVDPEERRLQELALALRAEAPEADPVFAAQLDERVAGGFPGTRPSRGRLMLSGRVKPLALATAASAFLALVVVVGLTAGGSRLEGGDGDGSTAGGAAPAVAERQAAEPAPADSGAAPDDRAMSIAPDPGGGAGIAPGERTRRIQRSASLSLAAPGDRLDSVADQIVAVVDRRRGFVLSSSLTTGDEGTTGGTFDLRVPARDLQATLRDLSGLADVRARTQQGQDVTRAYVTVDDRLDGARAERRSLLRRLERADTDNEAQAIRERLNLVSGEIRGLIAQLRDLRERTSYAAVTVQLEETEGDGGGSGTGAALDDALDSLVGSLNLAVRVLGAVLPFALLAGLAWLALGGLRRRRREAALG